MANTALAVLESALRARKLDRTLTTALPPLEQADPSTLLPTGLDAVDACLRPATLAPGVWNAEARGGLPRGQLSEIAGPRSSGRTTLLLQLVAAASQRGEIAALVDTFDRLDLASARAAGVDLDRLLWIRGQPWAFTCGPSPSPVLDRTLDRALKALNLVLQAGGFGVVALDLADVPVPALKRLPYTTWLRVQRTIEGSDTACVLITPEPLARSAGGLTLSLGATAAWTGDADRSRRLQGLDIAARIVSPRRRVAGDVRVAATTTAPNRSDTDAQGFF